MSNLVLIWDVTSWNLGCLEAYSNLSSWSHALVPFCQKNRRTKLCRQGKLILSYYILTGGAELFVPAGKWLTGSFNLISHLTLSLHKDAVIIGSMVSDEICKYHGNWFYQLVPGQNQVSVFDYGRQFSKCLW